MEEFSAILPVECEDGTVLNAELLLCESVKAGLVFLDGMFLSIIVDDGYQNSIHIGREEGMQLYQRLQQDRIKLVSRKGTYTPHTSIKLIDKITDQQYLENIHLYYRLNHHMAKVFKHYMNSQMEMPFK